MHLPSLFQAFVRERRYLSNVTPKTIVWHESAWGLFGKHLPADLDASELTGAHLKTATMALASGQRSAITVNSYARSLNAFLGWAHTEGHLTKRLRIGKLKEPQVIIATLRPAEVQAVIKWNPKRREYKRLQVLLLLILDCGLRLNEALMLERSAVDWDMGGLKVYGKGRKERIVPISQPMKRRLWQWLKTHEDAYVFPNRTGGPLSQTYVHHAMARTRDLIGIPTATRFYAHGLRHSFATAYLRAGGNVVVLQRILGHADLQTTMRYVHLQTADLTAVHDRYSPLTQR
ncbi:MAG: tyrosine-type recombinase/integrase [Bryobacterales bacterium]